MHMLMLCAELSARVFGGDSTKMTFVATFILDHVRKYCFHD